MSLTLNASSGEFIADLSNFNSETGITFDHDNDSGDGSTGTTSNDANITIDFALSESSPDFNTNDVSVSGGTLSSFQKRTENSYSATFTPTGDGSTSISVGAGTFIDDAGNLNISSK